QEHAVRVAERNGDGTANDAAGRIADAMALAELRVEAQGNDELMAVLEVAQRLKGRLALWNRTTGTCTGTRYWYNPGLLGELLRRLLSRAAEDVGREGDHVAALLV